MNSRLKCLAVVFGIVLMMPLFGAGSASAEVGVNLNINVGAPPPVVVASPPTMLFLGQPGLYVAVGVPYDIYYIAGRYYYFHDGHWFWAAGYGGPWVFVEGRALPPGLRKYRIEQLRGYRDREFKSYKVQGPKYNGRHFVGDRKSDPKFRGDHPGNAGRGNGHGKHK
jgi:hypothetical protein